MDLEQAGWKSGREGGAHAPGRPSVPPVLPRTGSGSGQGAARGGSRKVLEILRLRAREYRSRFPGSGCALRVWERSRSGACPVSPRGGMRKVLAVLNLGGRFRLLPSVFCLLRLRLGWLQQQRGAPALFEGVSSDVMLLSGEGT